MVMNFLPPVSHVMPQTVIRRERRLPAPGVVTVQPNQRVQAYDVVAELTQGQRHIFVDIARGLGMPENQVIRHMAHEVGGRVSAGEVLAGPYGWARRTVKAPASGRIVHYAAGRVLLEVGGRAEEIKAGIPGVVVGTDGIQTVTIETNGSLVQGIWGNSKEDYGGMNLVGDSPEDRLSTELLDIKFRGAVLVCGYCDNAAPLHQATELSVKGLVLGGLAADLVPVVRRLPYAVVILQGFGKLPIDHLSYRLLKSMEGQQVSLDGRPRRPLSARRPEVIIPSSRGHEADLADEIVPLTKGAHVRITRSPYHGQVGLVQDLHRRLVSYPSGIVARSVRVDLEGIGPKDVPLANLEIIQ